MLVPVLQWWRIFVDQPGSSHHSVSFDKTQQNFSIGFWIIAEDNLCDQQKGLSIFQLI